MCVPDMSVYVNVRFIIIVNLRWKITS